VQLNHLGIHTETVSERPREDPQSKKPFFDKEQTSAMITWLFLFLGPLTRNVRWNVCNEIHVAHIQSTWGLAEAEFIIINRNNIKLFDFTISGDRRIVFSLIFPAFVWILLQFGEMNAVTQQHFQDSLSLADGNFELFYFSAYLSTSFLF